MSGFDPIFQILIEGLREIQLIRYTRASAAVTVLFDYLITFDREVNLIWKRQWSWVKVLFFINRYYVLATSIFDLYAHFPPSLTNDRLGCSNSASYPGITSCLRVFQWEGITGLVGCIVADATLQLRIYALYSGSKKILFFMISVYVLCVTASGYVVGEALKNGEAFVINIPGGQFCDLKVIPQRIYAFWIPMLFFQTLLCILAIIPAIRSFKSEGIIFNYRGKGLYNILIRDSTIYFAVIAFTYISCLTVWIVERKSGIIETPIGFAVAIQCSLCSRIILNLREADQLVVSEDSEESFKAGVRVYGSGGY